MDKIKSQELADKIQPILQIIDGFMEQMEDGDLELLEESKNILREHISRQNSAATLTLAFGIETDTLDEEYKLKTLDILIKLLKLRKEYKEEMIENINKKRNIEKNRQELMKIFGNM